MDDSHKLTGDSSYKVEVGRATEGGPAGHCDDLGNFKPRSLSMGLVSQILIPFKSNMPREQAT